MAKPTITKEVVVKKPFCHYGGAWQSSEGPQSIITETIKSAIKGFDFDKNRLKFKFSFYKERSYAIGDYTVRKVRSIIPRHSRDQHGPYLYESTFYKDRRFYLIDNYNKANYKVTNVKYHKISDPKPFGRAPHYYDLHIVTFFVTPFRRLKKTTYSEYKLNKMLFISNAKAIVKHKSRTIAAPGADVNLVIKVRVKSYNDDGYASVNTLGLATYNPDDNTFKTKAKVYKLDDFINKHEFLEWLGKL